MRSVIFGNSTSPAECHNLGVTVEIEQSNYSISAGTCLHIWDCGGQDVFVNAYLDAGNGASSAQRQMFSQVQCVVFVFDVGSADFEKEQAYFTQIIGKVSEYSKGANIFCLLHKMDLIPPCRKADFQRERFQRIHNYHLQHGSKAAIGQIQFFGTSIWDESLFKAWSAIICTIIPNLHTLEGEVQAVQRQFGSLRIEQTAVFDKSSMLLLAVWPPVAVEEEQCNWEQFSSIIKQYRKCAVEGGEFEEIRWRSGKHEWHFGTFRREFVFVLKVPLEESKEELCALLSALKSL